MPHQETTFRNQKAVYWQASGVNDDGELTIVSTTGTELDVRWEYVSREIIDAQNNTIRIDAEVVVAQAITDQSIFWKGELVDLPDPVTNLFQVVAYSEIPDIKNKVSRRVVSLVKYGDTLPRAA